MRNFLFTLIIAILFIPFSNVSASPPGADNDFNIGITIQLENNLIINSAEAEAIQNGKNFLFSEVEKYNYYFDQNSYFYTGTNYFLIKEPRNKINQNNNFNFTRNKVLFTDNTKEPRNKINYNKNSFKTTNLYYFWNSNYL